MEVTNFFKLLGVLLIFGVLINLMIGTALPTVPSFTPAAFNVTSPSNPTCTDGGLLGLDCIADALMHFAEAVVNFVIFLLTFLYNLGLFLAALVVFFTGLNLVFTSGNALIPTPLNFIIAVFLFFGWIFLIAEAVSQLRSMVMPK